MRAMELNAEERRRCGNKKEAGGGADRRRGRGGLGFVGPVAFCWVPGGSGLGPRLAIFDFRFSGGPRTRGAQPSGNGRCTGGPAAAIGADRVPRVQTGAIFHSSILPFFDPQFPQSLTPHTPRSAPSSFCSLQLLVATLSTLPFSIL